MSTKTTMRGHTLRLTDLTHNGRRLWAVEPGTCSHAAKPATLRPFLHSRAECAEYLRDRGASATCWAVVSHDTEGLPEWWIVHARARTQAGAERQMAEIKRALTGGSYLPGLQVRHADDVDFYTRCDIAGL
jgi:hypothetical protein